MAFVRASKKKGKLRLGLVGPSGAGKTYSALAVATEIAKAEGGRIAVVDSEHGSASLYSSGKPFDFDVLELSEFSPERYIEAIREAEKAGYSVIVLDSLSHAWVGKGGALELKDNASRRAGENSYTAWRHVTPLHNQLIDSMLQSPCHVIATMRTKTEYVLEANEKGKMVPKKIGTTPVQRDGMEYEFTVVGDIDQDHVLSVTKSRCPSVADRSFRKPGQEFAAELLAWLTDGDAQATPPAPPAVETPAPMLSPGVDPPAMNGVSVPPPVEPKPGPEKPALPRASQESVRRAWEQLKAQQNNDNSAHFMWTEAVRAVFGVDPKQKPSSTWSVEDLEKVISMIWPQKAA